MNINEVYLGDCLEVMKNIPNNSIDLIITDPPYLINYKTNHRKDKTHDFCSPIKSDSKNNIILITKYIKECYRIMKLDTAMYMFCSPDTIEIFKSIVQTTFKVKNIIIWVKNNWTAGDLKAQFGKQYEMILLLNKGRKFFNGHRITDVWHFNRIAGKKQLHQNEKPIDLIETMITKHSDKGDLIFDGFAGSGVVGEAAYNFNRNYILIEKEEKYYDIIQKRLEERRKRNGTT